MHDLPSAGREKFYYGDRKRCIFFLKKNKNSKIGRKNGKICKNCRKNYGKIKLHIIKIF